MKNEGKKKYKYITVTHLEDIGGCIELGVVARANPTKYAICNAKRCLRRRHVGTDLQYE